MIAKIFIPTINTSNMNFDYGRNISNEEYGEMVMDKFMRTNDRINMLMNNMGRNGRGNIMDGMYDNRYSRRPMIEEDDSFYDYQECEALVLDAKKNEVDESFFENYIENGDMFLVVLNINPNTLTDESQEELRFWMDDSKKIHRDMRLDNRTKMNALPYRTIKIELNGKIYKMTECKIIQDFSTKKSPYFFAMITNKIKE